MLVDERQLRIVEVFSHVGDDAGNDGPGLTEPLFSGAALGPVLKTFEKWSLRNVIEEVCHV